MHVATHQAKLGGVLCEVLVQEGEAGLTQSASATSAPGEVLL